MPQVEVSARSPRGENQQIQEIQTHDKDISPIKLVNQSQCTVENRNTASALTNEINLEKPETHEAERTVPT